MPNSLAIHDTVYDMTPAYREGGEAMRRRVPHSCNPHRVGSQAHADWDYGHTHEAGHEHLRFGLDLLTGKSRARTFEMDPEVPRDKDGNVEDDWAQEARRKVNLEAA